MCCQLQYAWNWLDKVVPQPPRVQLRRAQRPANATLCKKQRRLDCVHCFLAISCQAPCITLPVSCGTLLACLSACPVCSVRSTHRSLHRHGVSAQQDGICSTRPFFRCGRPRGRCDPTRQTTRRATRKTTVTWRRRPRLRPQQIVQPAIIAAVPVSFTPASGTLQIPAWCCLCCVMVAPQSSSRLRRTNPFSAVQPACQKRRAKSGLQHSCAGWEHVRYPSCRLQSEGCSRSGR